MCSSLSAFIAVFGLYWLCCFFNESIAGDEKEFYNGLCDIYDFKPLTYTPSNYDSSNWSQDNVLAYGQPPDDIEQSYDHNWYMHPKQAVESSKKKKSKTKSESKHSVVKITKGDKANACYVCGDFFKKERKETLFKLGGKPVTIETPSVKCNNCGNWCCMKKGCEATFKEKTNRRYCTKCVKP